MTQDVEMPDTELLIEREQQRIQYLASEDYDNLEAMLSPTLTYTHSNSSIDHKEEFMQPLRSGEVIYQNLVHRNLEARFITPNVGILNGISDVYVTVRGEELVVPLRFTIVYVNRDGEWLFEAWQSTSIP
ncbi:MAG: nuclear transport factor 2 family protein [Balneolales bacterium]